MFILLMESVGRASWALSFRPSANVHKAFFFNTNQRPLVPSPSQWSPSPSDFPTLVTSPVLVVITENMLPCYRSEKAYCAFWWRLLHLPARCVAIYFFWRRGGGGADPGLAMTRWNVQRWRMGISSKISLKMPTTSIYLRRSTQTCIFRLITCKMK